MKIAYDKKADSLALVVNPGQKVVKDKEIAPNVFVGYAKDRSVVEIQILDVSKIEDEWLNLQTAAALLNVSERTLQRRIVEGRITPKKVGREYQISPQDLVKLKKAN